MRSALLVLLITLIVARPVVAQQVVPGPSVDASHRQTAESASAEDSDATGKTVIIRMAAQDRVFRGRLIELTRDLVRVEVPTEGGDAQPRRAVVELELARVGYIDIEEHDSLINGAVLGALFLAACAAWWCSQGTDEPVKLPRDAFIGAGLGALVGASIDAKLFERRRIWDAPLVPSAHLQPALRFSFRW
jgi:hypothetical protein